MNFILKRASTNPPLTAELTASWWYLFLTRPGRDYLIPLGMIHEAEINAILSDVNCPTDIAREIKNREASSVSEFSIINGEVVLPVGIKITPSPRRTIPRLRTVYNPNNDPHAGAGTTVGLVNAPPDDVDEDDFDENEEGTE